MEKFRFSLHLSLVLLFALFCVVICDFSNETFSSLNSTATLNDSLSSVGPLDLEELEESAKIEEIELEEEIAASEAELEQILKAEEEEEQNENELEPLKDLKISKPKPQTKLLTEERKEEIKEKAVQNLRQIFRLSNSSLVQKVKPPPPEFMLELYNTITDAGGVTRAKNPFGAHIVRSFLEESDLKEKEGEDEHSFYFNISSFPKEEKVLEGELHLFRLDTPFQKLHPSLFLNPFYVLSLYQVKAGESLKIPELHKLLSVQYVPALGSGWQVFNVKQAIGEWLSGAVENHGFLISAESVAGTRLPIKFARRGHDPTKQPLLVLFDEDEEAEKNPETTPPTRVKVKVLRGQDGDEHEEETYETVTPLSSLEAPTFHHSLLFQDSIRHPASASRFRARRSRNESLAQALTTGHATNLTECSRHDLFVSFEAIGWSSWIISPKGYNAHYCDGPCVFPLGQDSHASNHATVQSIINELGLHPQVSRPCCVPSTLLPISLLYYDDNDNVVLKQYVDMVAESCSCR